MVETPIPRDDCYVWKVVTSILGGVMMLMLMRMCMTRPTATRPVAAPATPVRTVSVQSPVAYKRFTSHQRYQHLGDRDWGAWAEG